MFDYELQFYVNYGVFSQGNSANKNLKLFGCCNMQTKFRNKCYLNKNLFLTISREIHNRGTWDQAHCCFLIFSYIPILFLEKNRFYEKFEISWAIDFAVFAFWSHWTQSDSCGKIAFKIGKLPILIGRRVAHR
ncbi:hypothetical protein T12_7588 [Trichinella patagoniensis]|uniref:Uncharacterized protein n=1 Tax=Trichinella patagoniensis TaxID=990121 RepID=A0A0V0Z4T7_9BILA|nr:hypothetical protein T12_7588 [Trichinella patagoniensis]